MPRAPRSLIRRGETVRLVVMGLVLLTVAYMIISPPRVELPGAGGNGEAAALYPVVPPWYREARQRVDEVTLPTLAEIPRPARPFVPDPEVYAGIEDGGTMLEEGALVHLLHQVNDWDLARLRAEAKEQEIRDVFWKDPGTYRGRAWFVRGTFLGERREPVLVSGENPSGVGAFFRAAMVDHRDRPMNVLYIDKERDFSPGNDTVEAAAVFFKVQRFEAADGRHPAVPIFVAKRLEKYRNPTAREVYPTGLALLGVGAFVIVLVTVLAIVWYGSRRVGDPLGELRRRHPRIVDGARLRSLAKAAREQKARGIGVGNPAAGGAIATGAEGVVPEAPGTAPARPDAPEEGAAPGEGGVAGGEAQAGGREDGPVPPLAPSSGGDGRA